MQSTIETPYQQITLADRRPAFHTGVEAQQFATAAEMLAASGLAGWNVQKVPALAKTPDGHVKPVPHRWVTVRTDTNAPLGVVGDGYQVIQNETSFAFGDMLLDKPGRWWSRAGFFKYGGIVFGALELGDLSFELPKDDGGLTPYLLIVNSHEGSTAYEAIITWIRPRCINTFTFARKHFHAKWRLRHVGDLNGKVVAAREALNLTFRHVEEVKPLATALVRAKVVDQQVRDILESTVFPITDKDRENGIPVMHPSQQAFSLYHTSPTLDGVRGTAWGAFQAVTEYVDHFTDFRTRVDRHTPDQQRAYVLTFGSGAEKKARALEAFAALVR